MAAPHRATRRPPRPLAGRVALVAGATRGAGRGIAVALGEAGATVYCSGRSTRGEPSPMARPETIEETAALVTEAGGTGIAVRTDHTVREEVNALMQQIARDHRGLDLLVNDVWGGDGLGDWLWKPIGETDLDAGWALLRQSVYSHLLTTQLALPLLRGRRRPLIVEITDGDTFSYRGALIYDLVKTTLMRIVFILSVELRKDRIAAVGVSPGFLRSEAMLELFEVTEETWREGARKDKHFMASETPRMVGRGIAALAADRAVMSMNGETIGSWELARKYKLDDLDGSRPDWLTHFQRNIPARHPARAWMQAGLSWQGTVRQRTRAFLKSR